VGSLTVATEVNETNLPYAPYSALCGNNNPHKYKSVIDPFIYRELEIMTGQHPRVLPIARKLLDYFSEVVTDSGASLTDLILTEAISEWSQRVPNYGYKSAFKAYSKAIFDKLPSAFDVRITGQRRNYPHAMVIWNPLKEGLVTWLGNNKVVNLKVERVNNDTCFSKRELALVIACHIFEQEELFLFGFGDIYVQEAVGLMEVKRTVIEEEVEVRRQVKHDTDCN
jgi:hypothetical protein